MLLSLLSQESHSLFHHEWYRASLGWQLNIATLGGGGMMAAFPQVCVALMPAIHTLVIAMLIGLIFRGVASQNGGSQPRR